jgi:uncharacterized protein with FMN-binding domain
MRRSLLALASTAVGLVMLLSYKTPDPSKADQPRPAAFGPPVAGATSATLRTGRSATARHTTTTTRAAKTATTRGTATTRAAQTTTTRPPAPARKQATGPVVSNQYGPVQVRVTVQGTKILDVVALQLPSDKDESRQISAYAAPLLRQRVLQAQSAQIDAVSGATYTSRSYIQSLQAALDSL